MNPRLDLVWPHTQIVPNGGWICWIWTGSLTYKGYGRLRRKVGPHRYREFAAHRLVYEAIHGPIPKGLELDHLCRNRACVRPDHLEAVTPRENYLRGESIPRQRSKQTHCKRGHEFAPENTGPANHGRGRRCLTCKREQRTKVAA